jgi:adenine-specific DNA-methyltransferase
LISNEILLISGDEMKLIDLLTYPMSLVGCFAQGITLETVQAIADMSTPENHVLRVVFRDSSFADDNVKTNAVQRLKQAGVREEDVVSV